jgi:hypothetical protein
LASRALDIEALMPIAEGMRARLGGVWAHVVQQGRMFCSTYLALAHQERGGVAAYLATRQELSKFRKDAKDWERMTAQAAATIEVEHRARRAR